jgi:trk system potassium uptake protein TrkH
MSPVRLTITSRRVQSRALASPLIIIYAFVGLIALGTLLLLMPFSHHGGGLAPFIDALFTATSAVTVTGLVIQDTATYWTRTGQVFILAMMFIGGLGFMTIATFLLILIGHRATLTQRLLVKDSLQIDQLGGLVRLTIGIVLVAAGIQLVGFVALLARFSLLYSPAEAVWQAVFHAVSGFNNAGFVVVPEGASMAAFKEDKVVLGILAALIFLGAISYWVMVDLVKFRRFSLFTLTSKLVLVLTLVLTLSGALVFFFSEYDNDDTLGQLSVEDKVVVSVFESISGRTAGFSTVSYGETAQHTNFFFTALMFIGGASASVAGGIKVNTLAVVLVAVLSTIRGSGHASAFGREIPRAQVQRAMSIGAVAIAFVFLVGLMLTFAESTAGGQFAFIDLLFEIVSAAGTVGLSTGLTAELSKWGHIILIGSMFLGRVGPLTLALYMAQSGERDLYRYAQERVTIG